MSAQNDTQSADRIPTTPPAHTPPPPNSAVFDKPSSASRLQATSMTPPPSSHVRRIQTPPVLESSSAVASSEPSPNAIRFTAASVMPSAMRVANATAEELRKMVEDLVAALADARMSAAHYKLQHSLLLMETNEAAQRAEVEQQMARREVEVLQASEQRHRITVSAAPQISRGSPQPQIIALTQACRTLEDERDDVEDQLQETKKVLEHERERSELLTEENLLLKRRIRENRAHFTRLKDQSPMYSTPRQAPYTTPRRKPYSRYPETTPAHDNFAALLYADQMLSQETASVPSTPTKTQSSKFKRSHTRGAHSLSSLQPIPIPTDPSLFTPSHLSTTKPTSQPYHESALRSRHDRDSTISISDPDDSAPEPEDLPQSQASSLATSMLRANPASQETIRASHDVERSSNLLQTKLFGNIKKPSTASPAKPSGVRGGAAKRNRDPSGVQQPAVKKSKLDLGGGERNRQDPSS